MAAIERCWCFLRTRPELTCRKSHRRDDQVVARASSASCSSMRREQTAPWIVGIVKQWRAYARDLVLNVDQVAHPSSRSGVRSDCDAKFAQHRETRGNPDWPSKCAHRIDQGSKRHVHRFAGARSHERIWIVEMPLRAPLRESPLALPEYGRWGIAVLPSRIAL